MTDSDLRTLQSFLSRNGGLDSHSNKDLMDDAIYAGAGTYRCEQALKTLAYNLRREGRRDLAENVEYYL